MKIAIISDTHFGDSNSVLINCAQNTNNTYNINKNYYGKLKAAIGDELDVLVLLGDIFDFSVTSPNKALEIGRIFLNQLCKDYAKNKKIKVVYVPGNHDFGIWQNIEYEVNVIQKIRKGELPREFKGSVPGVIDLRKDESSIIDLPTVNRKQGEKLGEIYLDGLVKNMTFIVAYPNVYLQTENESFLLTHGQYLEPTWSIVGDILFNALFKELNIRDNILDIEQIVKLNLPISQLTSSSLGQAGKLTPLVQSIEHDAKEGKTKLIKRILDKLDMYYDKILSPASGPSTWYREIRDEIITTKIKDGIIEGIEEFEHTRYNEQFISDPKVRKRFENYFYSSKKEIHDLNHKYNTNISEPNYFLFGHTHYPDGINDNTILTHNLSGKIVTILNTGGLIFEPTKTTKFKGAAVFLIDSKNQNMTSTII